MYGSAAASISTRTSVVSSMVASMANSKPTVTITLKGEESTGPTTSIKTFTTLDTIEGEVSIVAPADTRFDEIGITLEGTYFAPATTNADSSSGTARTWMERYGASGMGPSHSEAVMTFLRVTQPVDESALPIPRIAEKGKTYTFPFTFVVPERLLPTACSHCVQNPTVVEEHLRLPPSMGDQTAPKDGECALDDASPDMTKISYMLRARILRRRESDNKMLTLQDTARKVRIIPTVEDLPPLLEDASGDYVLSKEKDIRKGLFKGKLGRLVVDVEQPMPLQVKPGFVCPPTTTVPMAIKFIPADESYQPPKLGTLTTKLRISTFYATKPMTGIPRKAAASLDASLGCYSTSVFLSSRCVEGAKWTRESSSSNTFYTTHLLVPVIAPKCKILVPTFNSCLISRQYALELSFSVQASAHTSPSLSLTLPLQVSNPPSSPPSASDNLSPPAFEEFFTPRSIAPPSAEQQSGEGPASGQLPPHMMHRANFPPPPGYSFFAPPGDGAGVPARIPSPVGISPGCG
ncbi:hypothetical protein RUND412_009202 [Rhizina undulata]